MHLKMLIKYLVFSKLKLNISHIEIKQFPQTQTFCLILNKKLKK